MSVRLTHEVLSATGQVVAPPAPQTAETRNFELPVALYGAMAALFAGFLAVMAFGFSHPEMIIPMAINFTFLAAFFAVPTLFVRGDLQIGRKLLRWSEFMAKGIETETGHSTGREAVVLALLMPVMIFLWGITVVTIAASV
jgi:hypothetical protein